MGLAILLPVMLKRRGLVRAVVAGVALGWAMLWAYRWWWTDVVPFPLLLGMYFGVAAIVWHWEPWSDSRKWVLFLLQICGLFVLLVLLHGIIDDVVAVQPGDHLITWHMWSIGISWEELGGWAAWLLGMWGAVAWMGIGLREGRATETRWQWRVQRSWRVGLAMEVGAFGLWVLYTLVLRTPLVAYVLMPHAGSRDYAGWRILQEENVRGPVVLRMLEKLPWDQAGFDDTYRARQWLEDAGGRVGRDVETTDRLVKLFTAHPESVHLAMMVAARVGEHPHAEAILLLLEHALEGDSSCIAALQRAELPQLGWAVLFNLDREPLKIRLETLYHQTPEVGREYDPAAWEMIVRARGHGRHAPIPDAICDEADEMVSRFARCHMAADLLLIYFRQHSGALESGRRFDLTPMNTRFVALMLETVSDMARLKPPWRVEQYGPLSESCVRRYEEEVNQFLTVQASVGGEK